MESTARRTAADGAAGPAEGGVPTGRAGVSDECGECGALYRECMPHATYGVCHCTPCPQCPKGKAIDLLIKLHDHPETTIAPFGATARYAATDALAAIHHGDMLEVARRSKLLALCGQVTSATLAPLCNEAARALIDYLGWAVRS